MPEDEAPMTPAIITIEAHGTVGPPPESEDDET